MQLADMGSPDSHDSTSLSPLNGEETDFQTIINYTSKEIRVIMARLLLQIFTAMVSGIIRVTRNARLRNENTYAIVSVKTGQDRWNTLMLIDRYYCSLLYDSVWSWILN